MTKNTALLAVSVGLRVLLSGGTAHTQPGADVPPTTPQFTPQSTRVQSQGWDGVKKFGVGLRVSSSGLSSSADPDNTVELAGAGIHRRYRLDRWWEFELAAESLSARTACPPPPTNRWSAVE